MGIPPLRSTVVRASARGAEDRGSVPDRDTKDVKKGGLRFSAWRLAFNELGNRLGGSESVSMVWVILFCSHVAELNLWLDTQNLLGVDRSAQTRQVHINSHAFTCVHHRIELAVGDMTMSGWKPTISLIHPPLMGILWGQFQYPSLVLWRYNNLFVHLPLICIWYFRRSIPSHQDTIFYKVTQGYLVCLRHLTKVLLYYSIRSVFGFRVSITSTQPLGHFKSTAFN